MTLTDLMEEVIYLTGGEPVNLMTIYKFANKAMDVLANRYDSACIQKTATVNCTDIETEYAIPTDCIGIYKVIGSNNNKYKNYTVSDGFMRFGTQDTYTISYYAIPVMTTRTAIDTAIKTDIPPVNTNYHKCLVKYIAAEILKINNQQDNRVTLYTDDFIQEAKEVDNRLKSLKRANKRVKAPLWR